MRNISVIGATGIVGKELIRLLEKRNFPVERLQCFASSKSVGQMIHFKGKRIRIKPFEIAHLTDEDLIFFCTSALISKQYIPLCLKTNATIIDLSSAFRQEEKIPLIVPEINFEAVGRYRLIASPNCVASIMAVCIANLHKHYTIKRIVASTYQAASGGGTDLLQALLKQSKAYLSSKTLPHDTVAFNTYLHNSTHFADRYSSEEKKIMDELKKILKAPDIKISVTAVRVPVLRSHSISMNLQFAHPFSLSEAENVLQNTKGVVLKNDYEQSKFATSMDATDKEFVFCSRIRLDPSLPNTLELWVVGDQLLKGASLNAIQIAEKMIEKK